ncbi:MULTISPECIES: molecular chaperone DjiA [Halocynthiibacter]|uniref:Molecular chaperone DjiA n=1 Tax=Halocynthiibacter halioticoli TaxID=2986804 RepID=A0AAE3IX99_9RHOB|nr:MULTISPECIES: molecular chaperone DjiA [Halocynthiibacter]MCV6823788.1 molecular chaperone DjiA [Halocynthiibacter halioticoli]MCW4056789.1 molecular chaperone DjiA [Halocynthiibacter sp. SDUM655004]
MSLWSRISDAIAALRSGESLSQVFDRLSAPPERSVAFTIAVIALGAKMAKADGMVTRDEVSAFREVFHIPPEEEANAARVFNMARTDIAGFDDYARKIAKMLGPDNPIKNDLLEGLFYIAVADGEYHPNENEFLAKVAEILGISERQFNSVRARFVPDAAPDPYEILGVPHDAPIEDVRAAWRKAVRESHPDRMIARGVPKEAIKLAEKRLVAVNRAWEEIQKDAA